MCFIHFDEDDEVHVIHKLMLRKPSTFTVSKWTRSIRMQLDLDLVEGDGRIVRLGIDAEKVVITMLWCISNN